MGLSDTAAAPRQPTVGAGRRLRGALVGAGSIASYHMAAWRAIEDVEIVAIADPIHSRAAALAVESGIGDGHLYDGHLSLLEAEAEDLDFVDIATVPPLHREQVEAAADCGVHVLCQKPFAFELADAEFMARHCAERGVRCIVNENWRWRSWYRRVKELVDAGAVGTPHYAAFTCHRDMVLPQADGELPQLLTRQPYTREMSQLIILEWGIHLMDVLRFLLGPVDSVRASTRTISPLVRGEDVALVELAFAAGATGLIDISWASRIRPERRLIRGNVDPFLLEGDAGSIELDAQSGDVLYLNTGEGTAAEPAHPGLTPAEAYQRSFEACQRNFVRCLREGRHSENEADDNLQTLALALATYEAAAGGRAVALQ
jgi:predicted dehydrogenase